MKKKLSKKQLDHIDEIFKRYVKILRDEGYTYRQIRKFNNSLLDKIYMKYQTYQSLLEKD